MFGNCKIEICGCVIKNMHHLKVSNLHYVFVLIIPCTFTYSFRTNQITRNYRTLINEVIISRIIILSTSAKNATPSLTSFTQLLSDSKGKVTYVNNHKS